MSGYGAASLVAVTDLNEILTVYDCQHVFIARPDSEAEPWGGVN